MKVLLETGLSNCECAVWPRGVSDAQHISPWAYQRFHLSVLDVVMFYSLNILLEQSVPHNFIIYIENRKMLNLKTTDELKINKMWVLSLNGPLFEDL